MTVDPNGLLALPLARSLVTIAGMAPLLFRSVLAASLLGCAAAQEWRQLLPDQRNGHVLVNDEARGRSVLFGGNGWRGLGLNDTWVFDGRWHQVATPLSPSQRPALRGLVIATQALVLDPAAAAGAAVTNAGVLRLY